MDGTDADVWLVFPPLIETNFGSFYPSTAVLAAYLHAQGLRADQADLNEDFAVWLLRSTVDGVPLAGTPPPAESTAAAAGRWLARSWHKLVEEDGRHGFGPSSDYGHVLQLLARHYVVDPDEGVLDRDPAAVEGAALYRQFYEQAGLATRMPPATALIGISVPMGPQLLPALELAEQLKRLRPAAPIVLGGPALSLMSPPEIERLLVGWDAVDAVVRFDGEIPLHQLAVQATTGQWRPEVVPGVSCRAAGTVRHVPPGAGPAINLLPVPAYPAPALAVLGDPVLGVTQARGCYWGKCDYCDFVELYDGSPPFRGRRPDGFVAELRTLADTFGVSKFSFITESIPPAFARRVCADILAQGLDLRWSSFAMVDRRFDRQLLALMVEAGCEFLTIGMETTVTRVLKLVHKSADREENLRFLADARDVGLPLVINLIPDLPTTTFDEAMGALADVREFAPGLRAVAVFPFEPTRSSQVGRTPELFGLDVGVAATTTGQAEYALNHLVSNDPAMTPAERAEVHRQYRAFAETVNGRPAVLRAYGSDELLRVAVEDLDLLDSEAGLVCTNLRTRARAVIPERVAGMVRPHLAGRPFSPATMHPSLSPTGAARVLASLDRVAMLAPLGPGARAAGG
ncbi:MAG: hypothetical protein AVDCRST_MAG41-4519 [uncultured Corynebacteriales bacterium]|uniref:Uncharacterized protein n=1 Tax=uncultured Mycobacteriales bacterium TaxID=581187 RepID=A0A6J4JXW4_9ACTN|nr:MAG: hypothetical protein AVDCRST_MAG41-4519 [uncultured Corynebacteriales bacterium]